MNEFYFDPHLFNLFILFFIVGGFFLVVVVVPLWLILRHFGKKRSHRILARTDREELKILEEKAESLDERINTLESILDHDNPRWRQAHRTIDP